MPKLIWNPSRQQTYAKCVLLYHRLFNLFLDTVSQPFDTQSGQPFLGTLIHATQAAYEVGNDYKKAIEFECKEMRKQMGYHVKMAPAVDRLKEEAQQIFEGGVIKDGNGKPHKWPSYPEWAKTLMGSTERERVEYEVVDVEKRLWVDVGPLVIAPKLDAVVRAFNVFGREEETWWVVEHKSTARDDPNWRWRWEMDGQTTCQIVAAEAHYNVDFEGVLVNQVVVTRRKVKEWNKPYPPPLNKVVRYPARWVSKHPETRTLYLNALEDLAADFQRRADSGNWPATGMFDRECDFCRHRDICGGRKPASALVPIPKDELQIEFEKRLDHEDEKLRTGAQEAALAKARARRRRE